MIEAREPSGGALPQMTIQDLRTALALLAPDTPTIMVDYFTDWLEAEIPHLTGVGLAREILAIGAHLLANRPPDARLDRSARSSG